jgi:hypothetical protein
MIGRRAIASVAATAAVCVGGVPSVADPTPAIAGRQLVREARAAAMDAAEVLDSELAAALAAAREAAAVGGDDDPSPGDRLLTAAELVEGALADAEVLDDAVRRLNAARRAADPRASALVAGPTAAELEDIAQELRASASAADAAADLRAETLRVLDELDRALASVADGDVARARDAAAGAAAAHAALRQREATQPLPVWLDAADAMISAVTSLIAATDRRDAGAAAAARADIAALGERAATADRALDIALAETAGAATTAPLTSLASALASLDALVAAISASADAGP